MWKATFLAIGISLCILGGEALVIEKALLVPTETKPQKGFFGITNAIAQQREVKPPDWAPWSLLTGGMVVILYSITIPKRNG